MEFLQLARRVKTIQNVLSIKSSLFVYENFIDEFFFIFLWLQWVDWKVRRLETSISTNRIIFDNKNKQEKILFQKIAQFFWSVYSIQFLTYHDRFVFLLNYAFEKFVTLKKWLHKQKKVWNNVNGFAWNL